MMKAVLAVAESDPLLAAEIAYERGYNHVWSRHGHAHQSTPVGDWTVWLLLRGRGAGRTRSGAEWLRALVRARIAPTRIALVSETYADRREAMIDGQSSLAHVGHEDFRPVCEPSRRRLVWPNGSVGYVFSSEDPDGLRGFQFDAAWADANVDFIGIDQYPPLADWRDGFDHADLNAGWRSQHERGYLASTIEGGENFDWYYASTADRDA